VRPAALPAALALLFTLTAAGADDLSLAAHWRLAEPGRHLAGVTAAATARRLAVRITGPGAGDDLAVVDLAAGRPAARVPAAVGAASDPLWLSAERLAVVAGRTLRWWPEAGQGAPVEIALPQAALAATASADGSRLALAAADGSVSVLDAESATVLAGVRCGASPPAAFALSEDGAWLITAGADPSGTRLALWQVSNGAQRAAAVTTPLACLAWGGPEGALVAGGEGGLGLWRVPELAALRRLETAAPRLLALSPDHTRLALAADNAVEVWDLGAGTRLAVVDSPGVGGICFPEPGAVAVAAGDTLRLYQLPAAN